jgi:hypothetical protein
MRCADEGLDVEQTHQRVKTALAKVRREKRALFGFNIGPGATVGGVAGGAVGGPLGAGGGSMLGHVFDRDPVGMGKFLTITGLAVPAAAGILGGKILADAKKDPLTVEEAKTDEELSEIQRLTDRARRIKQLRAAQSSIGG